MFVCGVAHCRWCGETGQLGVCGCAGFEAQAGGLAVGVDVDRVFTGHVLGVHLQVVGCVGRQAHQGHAVVRGERGAVLGLGEAVGTGAVTHLAGGRLICGPSHHRRCIRHAHDLGLGQHLGGAGLGRWQGGEFHGFRQGWAVAQCVCGGHSQVVLGVG